MLLRITRFFTILVSLCAAVILLTGCSYTSIQSTAYSPVPAAGVTERVTTVNYYPGYYSWGYYQPSVYKVNSWDYQAPAVYKAKTTYIYP